MDIREVGGPTWQIQALIQQALAEDIGRGDITTESIIPAETEGEAVFLLKEEGVIAGLPVAAEVFRILDREADFVPLVQEGEKCKGGTPLARVKGRLRALLAGERVALNFLQHLSGIATLTAAWVALLAGGQVRLVDTRKTTPGLRLLEKYAVRVGGGHNHRFGLDDAVLIKDNHIRAAGGITAAVARVRATAPHTVKIEVETTCRAEVEEALACGVEVIMLDNMDLEEMRAMVKLIAGRALVEASGGITAENLAAVAATGVDIISVGALTHSAPALDISMKLS